MKRSSFVLVALTVFVSQCRQRPTHQQVTHLPLATDLKTLARATILPVFRQPGYAILGGFQMAYQRTRSAIRGNLTLPLLEIAHEDIPAPGTEAFEDLLTSRNLPPPTSGTLDILVDGNEYFPDFFQNLASAKQSVDVQSYIFDNDDTGVKVADALKQTAESIRVRVLVDNLGTVASHRFAPRAPVQNGFTPPDFMVDYLRQNSQIKVRRTTNPWLISDHTKLQIIDGQTAYLGGMNFGREYLDEWHDMMVRVKGPVVQQLQDVFHFHWRTESWFSNWTFQTFTRYQHARAQWKKGAPSPEEIPLRVIKTEIVFGSTEIATAMTLAIRGSRQRVYLETPYLTDDDIVQELIMARERGVDTRVIFPEENDSIWMKINNLTTAGKLKRAGVTVLMYPGMTHLKALLCDNWATLGSANLDMLSLRLNRELNLCFSDKKTVRDLATRVFEKDFTHCRLVTDEEITRKSSKLVESVSDQL